MSYLKCIRKHCAKRNRQTNVEILGGIKGITNAYITEDGRLIAEFDDFRDLQRWNENISFWKLYNHRKKRYYKEYEDYWDINMQLLANDMRLSRDEDYLYDTDDYAECYDCGEVYKIDDMHWYNDGDCYICEECYTDDFFCCNECGEIHRKDELIKVYTSCYNREQHAKYMCCSCARYNGAHQCDDCGEWFDEDIMRQAPDGTWYCDDCFFEHCVYCCRCEEVIWINDAYSDNDGNHYCSCCWEEYGESNHIRSYHNNPNRHKWYADNEEHHERLIGTEVETDSEDDNVEERAEITWDYGREEDYIYQMEDGSLGDYGIECITQPMSKKFWDAFDFEGWMRDLVDAGARAHDTSTCGLHVHLSRTWLCTDDEDEQAILVGRMRQFLADNIDLVQKFARRTEQRWCAFTKSFDKDDKPATKEERIAKHKEKGSKFNGDRYQSINNTNRATIEFRIFKGTLKPNTYRASVEFCLRVVDYILHTEENTETWKGFITYKQLPQSMIQYMTERHMQIKF